jgi:hypothetical protein
MPTLTILAWMAITSAVLHRSGPSSDVACLGAQVSILLSGMIETATLETGKDSRFRFPSRVLALTLYLVSVLMSVISPDS